MVELIAKYEELKLNQNKAIFSLIEDYLDELDKFILEQEEILK